MEQSIQAAYAQAREIYAEIGIDTDAVLKKLDQIDVSVHCWQGDDVHGFENRDQGLTGGIMATGNHPGCARTIDELRMDIEKAFSLTPGSKKLSLHASYLDTAKPVERDEIEPAHFASWVQWAKEQGVGLDMNSTFFSHPLSADGFTLSNADDGIRRFWIEHGKRCREIASFFGKETGKRAMHNIWVPDGCKEFPVDTLSPRRRLLESLEEIQEKPYADGVAMDAVESKLFGIGSEAYVVGSHEFYMGYACTHKDTALTLDTGHFHPTELVSAKLSASLLYVPNVLLHLSRPVRWDSDHVTMLDTEVELIMAEINRLRAFDRVAIGLDFFDGSINRIAAWVVGIRNTQKALLHAMLEPVDMLQEAERAGDFTTRLALTEELKAFPWATVWDYYCALNDVPVRNRWLPEVKQYEYDVTFKRS